MGKRWLRTRKKDYYYRKAKAEKYRSRAAFKLKQLNEKFKLIKHGARVLDLGAAPGGWTQMAREIAGADGFVLGVDIAEMKEFDFPNVKIIKGDFTRQEVFEEIAKSMPAADVVISDASPDISGVWSIDHFRSYDLCLNALKIAKKVLVPGGNLLIKMFQGEKTDEFVKELKKEFGNVKASKPKASRGESSEIYIIGKGYGR